MQSAVEHSLALSSFPLDGGCFGKRTSSPRLVRAISVQIHSDILKPHSHEFHCFPNTYNSRNFRNFRKFYNFPNLVTATLQRRQVEASSFRGKLGDNFSYISSKIMVGAGTKIGLAIIGSGEKAYGYFIVDWSDMCQASL